MRFHIESGRGQLFLGGERLSGSSEEFATLAACLEAGESREDDALPDHLLVRHSPEGVEIIQDLPLCLRETDDPMLRVTLSHGEARELAATLRCADHCFAFSQKQP